MSCMFHYSHVTSNCLNVKIGVIIRLPKGKVIQNYVFSSDIKIMGQLYSLLQISIFSCLVYPLTTYMTTFLP